MTLSSIWYDYLSEIQKNGHITEKDDGDKIREIIGVHKFLKSPQNFTSNFFNMDTSSKSFLSLIESGVYDIEGYSLKGEALCEYVRAWDIFDMIHLTGDMDFVYTYPERVFNYITFDKQTKRIARIDQYEVMVERLLNNINSNRAVATLYNCGVDRNEQHIPCLNFLQAIVRDKKLTLACMFRSNDVFNAWPSNMLLLTYLGLLLSNDVGASFKGIDYHCSSAHYYLTEEPLVEEVLKK